MLPVTHGAKNTRFQILAYTLVLAPLGLAPVVTGLGGMIYAVVATLLGLWFLYGAFRVFASRAGDADEQGQSDLKHAKRLFGASIVYLFVLFAALVVEHGLGLYMPVAIFGGGA